MKLRVNALRMPLLLLAVSTFLTAHCQIDNTKNIRWHIKNPHSTEWVVKTDTILPHGDNFEMSGKRISSIIYYNVSENRMLSIRRHLIFPQLRTFIKSTDNNWQRYRAYLKEDVNDDMLPVITAGSKQFNPGPLESVELNGMLNFRHEPSNGLALERKLFPSMSQRQLVEQWTIKNTSDSAKQISIGKTNFEKSLLGVKGRYKIKIHSDAEPVVFLKPNASFSFAVYFSAYLNEEKEIETPASATLIARESFLEIMKNNLKVSTPDSVLNTLFYFSKIRAAESIFESKMGLVHSPGGGRYYAGVWANDQAEYSAPFFPYLGYDLGIDASLSAYRMFMKNIPPEGQSIWSSFEMEGDLTCCGDDRGDAAMIAYGASQFVLATGDEKIAEELWPLIDWALSYCKSKMNSDGVINSDTDEMEGRIPTGTANLSTSSLYYGALLLASDLTHSMGMPKRQSQAYLDQAKKLSIAIDNYFGAEIEGLETYKYYKEHAYLRHWICLPLVMGINDRKDATIEALFSKLWMDNGVRVEYNANLEEPDLFWDRGTLYAFRGVFKAGASDLALEKLQSYSTTRLLGFHVPYVVEAWPEGDMAHLSAESALYARIFSEGILGMTPKSFKSFELKPHLPSTWNYFELNNIKAFNSSFSISISRVGSMLEIEIQEGEKMILKKKIKDGTTLIAKL